MSVFSTESQTPPPEFELGLDESQGENPQLFPVEEQLFSQKKLLTAKSKKHVMPLSSLRMGKEVVVKAPAPGAAAETKKPKPTPKARLAPLPMVKESVELGTGTGSELEPGLALVEAPPSTKNPKKPRQKGVSVLKLNVNPGEEDTPPQPLVALPTFQAKGKGSLTKLKPISVSSLPAPVTASAAAAAPEPVAPLQQPELEEQGQEGEK
jgi:hypothetical protein